MGVICHHFASLLAICLCLPHSFIYDNYFVCYGLGSNEEIFQQAVVRTLSSLDAFDIAGVSPHSYSYVFYSIWVRLVEVENDIPIGVQG
jgi:hypothetical protein